METRKYEITYIIRPDIEESAKSELVARFDKILADNGATVVDHIVNVTADSDASLNEFDRLAKFSDDILRHMIVKRG